MVSHGCRPDFAEALIRGEVAIADWQPSPNDWDWLGHGIGFWQSASERARDWSRASGVVGAIIPLGECHDFTDPTCPGEEILMLLTEENIEKISESIRVRGERLAYIQIPEMIDRGGIDKNGSVLLKRPEWGGQMPPGQPRPGRADHSTEADGSA